MRTNVLLSLLASACAGSVGHTGNAPPEPYDFKTPQIIAFAPGQIALGDQVQIVGKDFIDPAHGTLRLHFDGQFTADSGAQNPYQGDVQLEFKNKGLAQFQFGPTVFFAPNGDQMGTFEGALTVVSHLGTTDGVGDERTSDPLQLQIKVLPSILVQALHSVDDNCQPLTGSTIAKTNLGLSLKALGLSPASQSSPIRFRFHFVSPDLVVQYVLDQWYDQWPIMPTEVGTPPDGNNMFEAQITVGTVISLDPRSNQRVLSVDPPIAIGQQNYSDVKLYRLATGNLQGVGPAYLNFFVEADGGGVHAQRLITVKIYNQGEILPYNGNVRVLERFQPQQVSACFPGGDIGRDLSYTESQSEHRARSLSFRWDTSNSLGFSVSGGAPAGIFNVGASAQWSQTFGVDVTETVTSESSISRNLTAHILPGF